MAFDFYDQYSQDPWEGITQNERTWYDPLLMDIYSRASVYSQYVRMKIDMNAVQSREIVFNSTIPPRPNIGVLGNRDKEASRLFVDSFQKRITVQRYGNGMSLHKESQMFSYWKRNGDYGLIPIINQSLGQAMVDHLDLLARNAYFENYYAMFGDGSETGFSGIDATQADNHMSTNLLDAIWLGMKDRKVPWAAYPGQYNQGEVVCVTSPGALYDLKREVNSNNNAANQFVNINLYQQNTQLLNGEIGTYRNVRFVETPMAILWNAGEVIAQSPIKVAVKPGDGAPDPTTTPVEGVRYVGQPAARHYIEVADVTGFEVGDVVTVHQLRGDGTDGRSVPDGLDFTDPMAQNLEIWSINVGANRITFKEPYMMVSLDSAEGLETDLGGTVFGYVTKGTNVHTALFFNTAYNNGVVAGVAQPPRIYLPPAIDDFLSIYRITYDMFLKYQLWEPGVFEVAFLAGSNKQRGNVYSR